MTTDVTEPRTRPRRWWRWVRRLVLYPVLAILLLIVGLAVFVFSTRYTAGPAQEAPLALTGATVLVGTDLEPQDDVTVLVVDGIIDEVGPTDAVEVPVDAEVVDLSGATLLPGLIDLHVHIDTPQLEFGEDLSWTAIPGIVVDAVRHHPNERRDMLEHGVTAFRSLGHDPTMVSEMRQLVTDGELEGPRVFAAGALFTTRGGHPVVTIHDGEVVAGIEAPETPEEARAAVRPLVSGDDPFDVIKIVQERGMEGDLELDPLPRDVLDAIVEEAHAHDVPVVAHWGALEDLEDVLAAGVDGLEHLQLRGTMLDGWPDEVLQTIVERELALGPTLAVMEPSLADEQETRARIQQRLLELHEAGGQIVVSSDAPMNGVGFGSGVHDELELLVEAGLTPGDALRAATSRAAVALRSDEIGVVEPGRAADLLAVSGDPLDDISAIRDVAGVWRDGRQVVDQ